MNPKMIKTILAELKQGTTSVDAAYEALKELPFTDIGHTKIDNHREIRNGFPEVIYGEHKTSGQVLDIFTAMMQRKSNILATRVKEDAAAIIKKTFPETEYNPTAKTLFYLHEPVTCPKKPIAVVTAGTSDFYVAEEAKVTAEALGNNVTLFSDVGVAGIHRLFAVLEEIRAANVVIVVAGMEGALASVVAGLVDVPVIAVPTSVGYGASFGGISALLGMLTSCANGVTVVNIDNGFGAAVAASRINRLNVDVA